MCPTTVCRTITLNTWHKVRIIRNGLEGSLQLDSEPFVSGRSPAPMTSLNLGEPLYLGGFRYGHTEIRQGQGRLGEFYMSVSVSLVHHFAAV